MPVFRSPRERRLWLWALAAVVAIYSTIGLAPTVASELAEQSLLAPLFGLGVLFVAATVVTRGLSVRPGGADIAIALGITAAVLLAVTRSALQEERTHLIEYAVVGVFVYEALIERARRRRIRTPVLLAIVATALLGGIDEAIQALVPSRIFDPVDILFNALAGTGAIGTSVAFARVRRWRAASTHTDQRAETRALSELRPLSPASAPANPTNSNADG